MGHNPSEKAWELGHYYANPSNRMWKLLSAAGIVPTRFVASNDDDCPIQCGVGFTDVVRMVWFCVCFLTRSLLVCLWSALVYPCTCMSYSHDSKTRHSPWPCTSTSMPVQGIFYVPRGRS